MLISQGTSFTLSSGVIKYLNKMKPMKMPVVMISNKVLKEIFIQSGSGMHWGTCATLPETPNKGMISDVKHQVNAESTNRALDRINIKATVFLIGQSSPLYLNPAT